MQGGNFGFRSEAAGLPAGIGIPAPLTDLFPGMVHTGLMRVTIPGLLPAALALATAPVALAQFSPDPASPTLLASGTGEQVQPKVVAIPAGGFYMSWYDGASGYDPWVQRYDANGNGLWPNGGVKVLETSFSSTEDYGLTIDAAGNAVVVTRRDSPSLGIIAQAVSPEGQLLWGAGGRLVSTTGSVNSPKAGRAGDGAAVAGWTEGSRAKVMRLNANGTSAWATASTVTDGTATTILSDLQPGNGDSVIASVVRYTTFSGAKTLQAQKFSGAGAAMWAATNVRVFATGSLQFGNFPTFLPDGEGGAVFGWYQTSPLQCRVQWVAPDGTLRFGTNGQVTSTDTSREAVSPAIAYDPVARKVYASWPTRVPNSSIYGVAAQAFDEFGVGLWGPTGTTLVFDETVYSQQFAGAAVVGGFPMFTWIRSTSFGQDTVYAMSVDPSNGSARWPQPTAATAASTIGRNVLTAMPGATNPWALYVFERGGTGAADLFGARINADGTLGTPDASCADLNGDGRVSGSDLGLLLGQWGGPAAPPFDLNGDALVNGADLGILLGCWNP